MSSSAADLGTALTAAVAAELAFVTNRDLAAGPGVAEASIRYRSPAIGVVSASPDLSDSDDLLASQQRGSVTVGP